MKGNKEKEGRKNRIDIIKIKSERKRSYNEQEIRKKRKAKI